MSEFHEPYHSTPPEKWPELEARIKRICSKIRKKTNPTKKEQQFLQRFSYRQEAPMRALRFKDSSATYLVIETSILKQ